MATLHEAERVANLAVCEPLSPPAEILAVDASFADRVNDMLSLDLVLHLREGCHDGEQHWIHRCGLVDVAAPEVWHT